MLRQQPSLFYRHGSLPSQHPATPLPPPEAAPPPEFLQSWDGKPADSNANWMANPQTVVASSPLLGLIDPIKKHLLL